MYFAVDQYAEAFEWSLLAAMTHVYKHIPNMNFYALIDGAFELVRAVADEKPLWKAKAQSLYQNTPYMELGKASPQLMTLSSRSLPDQQEIKCLLDSTNGLPMLSIIASELDLNQLISHFEPFTKLKSDHKSFLLRYADTRNLPLIDLVLRDEKAPAWRNGIHTWWFANRAGQLDNLPAYEPSVTEPQSRLTIAVSENAFAQLVDGCEVDAIISNIAEQNSALLQKQTGSTVYERIHQLKTVMAQYKINQFIDQVFFSSVALASKPRFYKHQAFENILSKGQWQAGNLSDALIALDDTHWDEINTP